MLTVKQDGKRIVNPDIKEIEDFEKDYLFKILVVECGFMASHRKNVWTHTKDDKFSVQFDSEKNSIYFEYNYKSDKCTFFNQTKNIHFVAQFLKASRQFFQEMTLKE